MKKKQPFVLKHDVRGCVGGNIVDSNVVVDGNVVVQFNVCHSVRVK